MNPIIYSADEVAFTSNGLGRLRDCISCTVTEERNGIYECDFEYPVTGANYDLIEIGRIIGVTHDDTGDVQPFDIVSFSKPIDGVVTFHCTHISYRQSYMTVTGSNINSLSAAFTLLGNATPSNPFTYSTDKTSTGYLAAADGIPRTVRQMLGGIEGSILDAYGGEYEWNKWTVTLRASRGQVRDFSIRYGVNMLEYNDEVDSQGAYSSCIPYWANGEEIVVASRVDSGNSTPAGHSECVPLDLTDKFENKPTTTQLRNAASAYMTNNNTWLSGQTINVSFVRLQDMGEFADFQSLLTCQLCDTINVVFPDYGTNGNFKIVKTVWDVLDSKFTEMELGALSVSLSEALGISETADRTANTFNNLSVLNDLSVGGNITAGGHSSPIGTTKIARPTAAVSAARTTYVELCNFTLEPGVWIIVAYVRWPNNSNGYRLANVSTTSQATSSNVLIPAVNGNVTSTQFTRIVEPTTNTTYYLNAYHNSTTTPLSMPAGAADGTINGMYAIRIA